LECYHHVHGAPVYWRSPGGGRVYVWAQADYLKAYSFDEGSGTFQSTAPVSMSTVQTPTGHPGGLLSISANGSQDGILWATKPIADAKVTPQYGTLYAFDANRLGAPLWSSDQYAGDGLGYFSKNGSPTIANGKVYVSTLGNALVVYGSTCTPSACSTRCDGTDGCGHSSCAPTLCPTGYVCSYGTCAFDPCAGVTCAAGYVCSGGACKFDCSQCVECCNSTATACRPFPTCSATQNSICNRNGLVCDCNCTGCHCY
jgi:hypothetical protein